MCVYGYLPILFHMIAGTVNPTWLFHIGPRVNLTLAASSMKSFLAKWSQNFTKPSEQHPSVCLTVSCLPRLNCTTATAPWKFACFQTTDSWRPWYGWVHPQWPTELSSHTYTKWDIHRNGNLNPENDRPRDFAVSNLRKPNTYIYIHMSRRQNQLLMFGTKILRLSLFRGCLSLHSALFKSTLNNAKMQRNWFHGFRSLNCWEWMKGRSLSLRLQPCWGAI